MLALMSTVKSRRPLRWRIADRYSGRRGRNAILLAGLAAVLLLSGLLLLRGFQARELLYNDDGRTVKQRALHCPPAWKSMSANFNKADVRTDLDFRTCVEMGRMKVFTAFLLSSFIGIAAFGLSRLPEKENRSGDGDTDWDRALGEARRRQNETRTGPRS